MAGLRKRGVTALSGPTNIRWGASGGAVGRPHQTPPRCVTCSCHHSQRELSAGVPSHGASHARAAFGDWPGQGDTEREGRTQVASRPRHGEWATSTHRNSVSRHTSLRLYDQISRTAKSEDGCCAQIHCDEGRHVRAPDAVCTSTSGRCCISTCRSDTCCTSSGCTAGSAPPGTGTRTTGACTRTCTRSRTRTRTRTRTSRRASFEASTAARHSRQSALPFLRR